MGVHCEWVISEGAGGGTNVRFAYSNSTCSLLEKRIQSMKRRETVFIYGESVHKSERAELKVQRE